MNVISTSLTHKILKPRRVEGGKAPALLFLHGRGADETDLLGLAEYFDERLFIVSARAPFPFQLGGGFTWYEILEMGRPEPKMFSESYRKLAQFIDDILKSYPIDPTRLILCGFSMGTMMSYAMALTKPVLIHGVMANSGYVPEETDLVFQWNKVKSKPFFVSHGRYDPVIPVAYGQRARELLVKAEAKLTYREYDMGHQISEEALNDMMAWMSNILL